MRPRYHLYVHILHDGSVFLQKHVHLLLLGFALFRLHLPILDFRLLLLLALQVAYFGKREPLRQSKIRVPLLVLVLVRVVTRHMLLTGGTFQSDIVRGCCCRTFTLCNRGGILQRGASPPAD